MKSRVRKWGNSLAVRIPKPIADEIGVENHSSVEMMVEDGALVIIPDREDRWTLNSLLAGVTEENKHGEWETGTAVGSESW